MIRYFTESPVIVGGVGGSGTRVVTEVMKRAGYFMGDDLNLSNDNMQLAGYFPKFRRLIQNNETLFEKISRTPLKMIRGRENFKQTFIHNALSKFENNMYSDWAHLSRQNTLWGWKIPANFVILDILADHFKGIIYIHTIRHGLDMSYSNNQNQLYNWGNYYGVPFQTLPLPKAALNYWIGANKKAIKQARELLNNRFLLLNFDQLCLNPEREIQKLIEFLECTDANIHNLSDIIKIPKTMGRYKDKDLSIFSKDELEEVEKLGFICEIN